jgi:hypothetical protein
LGIRLIFRMFPINKINVWRYHEMKDIRHVVKISRPYFCLKAILIIRSIPISLIMTIVISILRIVFKIPFGFWTTWFLFFILVTCKEIISGYIIVYIKRLIMIYRYIKVGTSLKKLEQSIQLYSFFYECEKKPKDKDIFDIWYLSQQLSTRNFIQDFLTNSTKID